MAAIPGASTTSLSDTNQSIPSQERPDFVGRARPPPDEPSRSSRRRDRHGPGYRGRGARRGTGRAANSRPAGSHSNDESVSAFKRSVPGTPKEEKDAAVNRSPKSSEDVDADVCFICASPVVHTSLAPCNHRTCHICSLRLRALYKTKACAHCRVKLNT
jgi:hypothetical protein